MSINVLNTNADLSGKTIVTAEGDRTMTGLLSYSRSGSAPFAVNSGAAAVANLDADKLDGQHAPAGTIVGTSDAQVLTNKTLTAPTITTPTIDTPTVTASVNLTGGQVSFPATQVPSAGANVLDDYEEGSWTPTIGGTTTQSGQVYTIQAGRYVKAGKIVHAYGRVSLSTLGTITGNVCIKSLPFTSVNTANVYGGATLPFFANMTTSLVFLGGFVAPNTSQIELTKLTAAAGGTGSLAQADLAATTDFIFACTYEAAA